MTEFEKSSARELKIDDQDFHLYLSKNDTSKVTNNVPVQSTEEVATSPAKATAPESSSSASIDAPLVGTVYLQPKPNKPTYIKVGDHVHKGDVVCVIEAMKMLTEVKSDRDGIVQSVEVENGDLVEFKQPLFTITEDK